MAKTLEYVRPIESASGDIIVSRAKGQKVTEPWVITPAQIFRSDHELVKQYPHLFKPIEAEAQRPSAEKAVVDPGTKREG